MGNEKKKKNDPATEQFEKGNKQIFEHPMFHPILEEVLVVRREGIPFANDAWGYVTNDGVIYVHPKRRGTPEEWMYVIAHCALHLAFGHMAGANKDKGVAWNIACDCAVAKFLFDMKLGTPPRDVRQDIPGGFGSEEKLYQRLLQEKNISMYQGYGMMGEKAGDMIFADSYLSSYEKQWRAGYKGKWSRLFAEGLKAALVHAVNVAGGYEDTLVRGKLLKTSAQQAKEWFISSYPLLGAIAANFTLIEDSLVCTRMQIHIAAISPELKEIYINPASGLTTEEQKFVMAHEFLHAALRHDKRCQGRDPELWNVACDFVINGWLKEMRIGEMPQGLLLDDQFVNMSAESVYDRIVTDMRVYRKLATFRGNGLGDILPGHDRWWEYGEGVTLDDFYRGALAQGLEYHMEQSRGYLPMALVEEIRALSYPPIPWDVELAKWFDEMFTPLEKHRTYTRLSRRQSSTPDIPRPAYRIEEEEMSGRTYGVLLDTSGSMDRRLLANALGAIASYSEARGVSAVRVVFCDAAPYDQGYLNPLEIAGSVKVKGRGGTVLQPGIDLLDRDPGFPKDAPLLIITDGNCDRLNLRSREHAFLMPQGAALPFVPKGKVFRMSL